MPGADPYDTAAERRALRDKLRALEQRYCLLVQRRERIQQEERDGQARVVQRVRAHEGGSVRSIDQTRRSIYVPRETYDRFRVHCKRQGVQLSATLAQLIDAHLDQVAPEVKQ